MIMDVECPTCHGAGEVCGVTPSRRSRFIGSDDLSPDDFTVPCPKCLGTGAVEHDLEDDCDDDFGCDYCRNDGALTPAGVCPECDAEYPDEAQPDD